MTTPGPGAGASSFAAAARDGEQGGERGRRRASNRTEINAEVNKPLLPDLVPLDIKLPDADGMQVLARIRAHPKLARLPVVMMTGKAEASDVKSGLAAGADGYVTKPFRMSALMAAVNLVLGRAKGSAGG